APHHALRHRHGEVHLLRAVSGVLPGRCHRRGAELRIRHGDARGALLRQGAPAGERRPLGARDRQEPRAGCAVSVSDGMIVPALFFYLFAGVCIAAGFMVIAARNPVHSVLFLILAFVNAAGLFILLGAEFLAMILVIVYVGAVAVLFLFVVMMLDVDFAELRQGFLQYLPIGGFLGLILLTELVLVVGAWAIQSVVQQAIAAPTPPIAIMLNAAALGHALFMRYVYFIQTGG